MLIEALSSLVVEALSSLVVLSLISGYSCTDHCIEERSAGYLYKCDTIVGEELTIPCGPYSSNGTTKFIYYNMSHYEGDRPMIILNDTVDYLHITVTPYDNGVEVSCQSTTNDEKSFLYEISVEFPPTDLGFIKPPVAVLRYSIAPMCPLLGNPEPECEWEVYNCEDRHQYINPTSGHYFYPENCTMIIPFFKVEFLNYCFSCNATNYLGTAVSKVPILRNTTNICQAKRSITISPRPAAGSALEIDEGLNITLLCTVIGNSRCTHMYWIFTTSNASYQDIIPIPCNGSAEFDQKACTQVGKLTISNVSSNDSGNYTCINGNDLLAHVNIRVKMSVNSTITSGHQSIVAVIVGSVFGIIIVVTLVITMVTIVLVLMWWKLRRSGRRSFTYHLHYDNEVDYDAFLSFAEEDKIAAELMIKEPLEEQGYSICWHHDAFLPGHPIEDNMERFIYSSRYTIALVSQAFLDSQFCMTEINLTRRKMQELSRNLLVPVLVDPGCDLPSELVKITYVQLTDQCLIERIKSKLGKPMHSMEEVTAD